MPSYYSIIRYVPNPIAEEAINVGVAVFGGGSAPLFRFIGDWTRARQFGGESTEFLQRFAKQVASAQLGIFSESGAWDESKLRSVLGRWHNSIQFTSPRASLKEPAALLDEVATDFLHGAVKREALRRTRLNTEVRSMFRRMRVLAREPGDVRRKRVVPDFPIDQRTGLVAEFVVKNGVFHVMETIDYRGAMPTATPKFYETGAKALVLVEAKQKLGPRTQRYVIYSARPEDRSSIKKNLALLHSHADHLINYDSQRDIATFASLVKKATGVRDLASDMGAAAHLP
jgi:hypothetical protein